MKNKETFGKRFRTVRYKRRMTQKEVADKIGVTSNCITQWETGVTIDVSAGNLLKAAKVLNVCPYYLWFG
jgi:transcriptional regulator with XRE-family HTH domain